MSLIEIVLSRKEMIISLAVVGFVLLLTAVLIVAPVLKQALRRMSAQRKAKQAERIAQKKKAKSAKRPAQQKQPTKRAAVVPTERHAAPVTAETSDVSVTQSAPRQTQTVTTVVQEEPQPSVETEVEPSSMQDILNSVFTDEDADSRFEVLMQGIEPVGAEELLLLANQIAAQLRAMNSAPI